MADLTTSKSVSALPIRPDSQAANLLWQRLNRMCNKSPVMSPSPKRLKSAAISKKMQKPTQSNNLNKWISRKDVQVSKENTAIQKKFKSREKFSRTTCKAKLEGFGSGSSDDLPTFIENKSKKQSYKQTESFKRYGVKLPSCQDILRDQEQFKEYKRQVEMAQTLQVPTCQLSFSPLKEKMTEEMWLDCKHLSDKCIANHFHKHCEYLRSIMNGTVLSDRHKRYDDIGQHQYHLTTNSLTYNTSMIIFTFEQIEYILSLLRKKFDPDDTKADYFFKVLVPEFCLKVFMETYNFDKVEAIKYLERRPAD